ncbi:MAG TPA: AmmeMemoRadiSam system radical SAM enzyme [Candidatus Paceibacterota bacterium]|nr:AmmeMemoRadiSam system radical SAM enzyme [Verrucomicrobiota bacterium]HRY49274.1 AmmeMemoRadiSam system radical SAM enzyme [Candidatus Paceibacterota bacterium]
MNNPEHNPGSTPDPIRDEGSRLSRRQAITGGFAALTAVGGGSSLWQWIRNLARDESPADVFKGDAPSDAVWKLWCERGWTLEARHYLKLGRNVQCKVCPNNCILEPGDRSHCRNRINRDGILYTMAYGNPCTFHVDPIEKKPLFHFLPGSQSFSLATSGCVFRCLNCQNWEISQKKPEETKDPTGPAFYLKPPLPESIRLQDLYRLTLLPDQLPPVVKVLNCPSVSYTYSEPTAYFEYALDCCKMAREHRLKNVLVTCGSIEERPLREILQYVDAAHVDLKGFSDETYRQLNSGKLEPILNTLRVYRSLGVWFEVINLVVPTYTDHLDEIRRMSDWLVKNLGPDQPLHFSRFHPQHKLTHLPPTPVAFLVKAREIARSAGLRYVYVGNAPEVTDGETTFCPGCRRPVVERQIFAVTRLDIVDGRCRHCQTPIAGRWEDRRG